MDKMTTTLPKEWKTIKHDKVKSTYDIFSTISTDNTKFDFDCSYSEADVKSTIIDNTDNILLKKQCIQADQINVNKTTTNKTTSVVTTTTTTAIHTYCYEFDSNKHSIKNTNALDTVLTDDCCSVHSEEDQIQRIKEQQYCNSPQKDFLRTIYDCTWGVMKGVNIFGHSKNNKLTNKSLEKMSVK